MALSKRAWRQRGASIKHPIQARLDAVARGHLALQPGNPGIRVRKNSDESRGLARTEQRRAASVDALRGFTMFWIIGADGAAKALAEMLSGMGTIPSAAGRITTPTDRTRALTGLHRLSSQHGQHQGITGTDSPYKRGQVGEQVTMSLLGTACSHQDTQLDVIARELETTVNRCVIDVRDKTSKYETSPNCRSLSEIAKRSSPPAG